MGRQLAAVVDVCGSNLTLSAMCIYLGVVPPTAGPSVVSLATHVSLRSLLRPTADWLYLQVPFRGRNRQLCLLAVGVGHEGLNGFPISDHGFSNEPILHATSNDYNIFSRPWVSKHLAVVSISRSCFSIDSYRKLL